jgi:hypothetical protein
MLEPSYARTVEHVTADSEPTTDVAEDHDDVPQAAGLLQADHREVTSIIGKEQ